jgi:hypothetical protein
MQTDPYPRADYLWSLTVPRWNSAIGFGVTVLCGSFFGVLLTNAGSVTKPTLTAALFWFVIALTVFAVQAFGRWLVHPPLALAATKEGLITFYRPEQMNYGPPGRLIPWHSIQALSYKSYVTRRTRAHALVVQCETDGNEMHLDVWSEKIGRETLDRVRELHQRFSNS